MLATSNHVFSNDHIDSWVIGCGLGTSAAAAFILARTIKHCAGKNQPLLLDADALNLLARDADLSALLARNANLHVLTPHPAEAGRLLGVDAERQTLICSYLSAALLAGLVLNSLLDWTWADPVAALVIAGFAVREGVEAWRGDACCATSTAALRGGGDTPCEPIAWCCGQTCGR